MVHGLKDPAVHSVGDWRELLTDVVQSTWPVPSPYEATREAETGLGICGEPYYFYVMRTHDAFDFVVFLVEDVAELETSSEDPPKGASPFDSGGLWNGLIHPLDGSSDRSPARELGDRRRLFTETEVPLACWRSAFCGYVGRNYTQLNDYIRGCPPSEGTPPIANASPNEERAWTWEVRYPTALVSDNVRLRYVCMHPHELEDYRNWLPDNLEKVGGLERAKELADWVDKNVIVSKKPRDAAESLLSETLLP